MTIEEQLAEAITDAIQAACGYTQHNVGSVVVQLIKSRPDLASIASPPVYESEGDEASHRR